MTIADEEGLERLLGAGRVIAPPLNGGGEGAGGRNESVQTAGGEAEVGEVLACCTEWDEGCGRVDESVGGIHEVGTAYLRADGGAVGKSGEDVDVVMGSVGGEVGNGEGGGVAVR